MLNIDRKVKSKWVEIFTEMNKENLGCIYPDVHGNWEILVISV